MHRYGAQFWRDVFKYNVGFPLTLVTQKIQMEGCGPPAGQGCEEASYCRLQYRRMRTKVRRVSERFVYHGVERGDTSDEIAPYQARSGLLRPSQQERAGKPSGDFRRNRSELDGKAVSGPAEICPGEHHTRANNADTDFGCACDRQD